VSLLLKYSYVSWLKKYDWSLFCTLTFRHVRSVKSGHRLFCGWIASIEACEGATLSWIRMAEYGRLDNRLHFHVLIAGAHRISVETAEALWGKMAGMALVREYDRTQRGLEYTLKSIEDGPDYMLEIGIVKGEHLRQRQKPRPR
jgi:hypothetical protein